jgi:MFS family permease
VLPGPSHQLTSTARAPDIGWYAAAYQVASAPLQLLTGKIYQKFPLKWTFLGFFALFELGSVLCGAAQSSTMLVSPRMNNRAAWAGFSH